MRGSIEGRTVSALEVLGSGRVRLADGWMKVDGLMTSTEKERFFNCL